MYWPFFFLLFRLSQDYHRCFWGNHRTIPGCYSVPGRQWFPLPGTASPNSLLLRSCLGQTQSAPVCFRGSPLAVAGKHDPNPKIHHMEKIRVGDPSCTSGQSQNFPHSSFHRSVRNHGSNGRSPTRVALSSTWHMPALLWVSCSGYCNAYPSFVFVERVAHGERWHPLYPDPALTYFWRFSLCTLYHVVDILFRFYSSDCPTLLP